MNAENEIQLIHEELQNMNKKIDRIYHVLIGDDEMKIEGLVSKVQKHDKYISNQRLQVARLGGIATAATSEPLGVKVCVDKRTQAIYLAGSNGCSTSRTAMTLGAPTIDVKSIASLVTPTVVSIKVVAAAGRGRGSGWN